MAKTDPKTELREFLLADLWEFAQFVNPHYVYGSIHKEVFRWLQDDRIENELLLMPRGHLKSHCIATWAVWQITRDPTTTMVYLSAGEDLAKAQVYAIKNMMTSDQYRKLWPEMIATEEGRREKWSAFEINVDHPKRKEAGIRDSTIIVKTVRSNAIGLHCSHLVFDDIVVPRNAYSETGRREVQQAVSQFASIKNPDAITRAVGTVYHPEDVYQSLKTATYNLYDEDTGELVREVPLWDVREYVLEDSVNQDGSGEFLWPRAKHPKTGRWEGFNRSIREKKLGEYTSAGERHQFYAQYYNDPNDPGSHRVARELFEYYDRKHLELKDGKWWFKDKRLNLFAAMDIAWTTNKASDYTAIAVIGIDHDGYIYLIDLAQFKTDKYHEYYTQMIGLHQKWQFRKIRVESNAAGKLIANELKDMIRKNGDSVSVDSQAKTSHDERKEVRHAAILEPRYENQSILHFKGGLIHEYEDQVIMERPPHDDLVDAVCAAIEIAKPPAQRQHSSSKVIPFTVASKRFGGIRA